MKLIIFNFFKCSVIYNYLLLNNFSTIICQSNPICLTPDGHEAYCIPTRDCPPMVHALKIVKRPLSDSAQKQLHAYICITMTDFNVCCPSTPINIIENQPDDVVKKKNINSHRNYHLLPKDCGYVDIGFKIINGIDADLTEFPWMALLSFRESDNSRDFKCAGTILNQRYILTAAHCLEERSRLISVRVGEYDKNSKDDCYKGVCNDPTQDVAIEERIPHPRFNRTTFENDIGLLRVTPIKMNEKNIRPICLPQEESTVVTEDIVDISGWGLTKTFASRTSTVLQKARLPLVNHAECQNLYKRFNQVKIDERIICAGGGSNASFACVGDSGGPIQAQERLNNIIRYVQHGVVSLGPNSCDIPSTFTKVSYFMDWILDNIKP